MPRSDTQQVSAVIRTVTGEHKNTAKGPAKLYTVQADGGPYKTWSEEVAQAAFGLQGQSALVDFYDDQVSRDGRVFNNRYIVRAVPGPAAATAPAAATIPVSGPPDGATQPAAGAPSPAAGPPVVEDPGPPRMARAKATEVAARILAFPEFEGQRTTEAQFKLADAIVHYINTGQHPQAPVPGEVDGIAFGEFPPGF